MSELSLTLLRLGFLVALWVFVLTALGTLRRDLGTEPAAARTPRLRVPKEPRVRRRGRSSELVVRFASGEQQRLPLDANEVSFGRAAGNTVLLDDDFTSAHHAIVRPAERGWQIEDCGSTNGTWVNRRRITSATPLRNGMQVRIGRTEVEVRL